MGEILIINNIKILIYTKDHEPPHIHIVTAFSNTRLYFKDKKTWEDLSIPYLESKTGSVFNDNYIVDALFKNKDIFISLFNMTTGISSYDNEKYKEQKNEIKIKIKKLLNKKKYNIK